MVEIIRQHEDTKDGNDCTIYDAIILYSVHGKYVVEVVRKYSGWADNGLDFRSRREFDDIANADAYYWKLVNGTIGR